MNLNLTLEALKFANVSTFSRTFGTKKTGAQNGGSLTTEEFNIANALPFDKMRPIELTENSTTGYVEYDANLVINSANITLTLNSGTYKGVKVKVYAQTAGNVVHDSNVIDSLFAGERAIYEWNGTTWDYVGGTPLGQMNYTTMCSTALATAKTATIKGFTLKDGTTIDVYFVNGHYAALSTDPFTINVNGLGAKKIYICKDGVQALMTSHQLTRSESGDSAVHSWFIQPNTTLKLMYISTLDSDNGGFVVIGNPIVLSGTDYTIYADGYNEQKNIYTGSGTFGMGSGSITLTKEISVGVYVLDIKTSLGSSNQLLIGTVNQEPYGAYTRTITSGNSNVGLCGIVKITNATTTLNLTGYKSDSSGSGQGYISNITAMLKRIGNI